MLRILIIITLILMAIPLFNKARNYGKSKIHEAKAISEDVIDAGKKVVEGSRKK